ARRGDADRAAAADGAGAVRAPPRAAGAAPPPQLAPARQVLRRRRFGLRGQPRGLHARALGLRPAPPDRGDDRLRGGGGQQLLVEPPMDVRRARREQALPGAALLRGEHGGVRRPGGHAPAPRRRRPDSRGRGSGGLRGGGDAAQLRGQQDVELRRGAGAGL
ncbi:MAG: hypothetical protein AVDCRST_MAG45-208, partial [uncultured Solirubrobacterales bacterium]